MSKRSNMIKMVTLLQSRGRMKTSELAQALEVSERQIRTYRNDLEMGGIVINFKSGRYGGYELVSPYLNYIDLSVNELAAIDLAQNKLRAEDYDFLTDLSSAYEKLRVLYKHRGGELRNYTKYFMSRERSDFLRKYYDMNQAEEIFVKVKIHYPFSVIVSERVWAQEQEFDWVDSDTIIFSARLQGRQEIIGWILSMGNLAEVLEPADLVEDISREIKLIARKY